MIGPFAELQVGRLPADIEPVDRPEPPGQRPV